MKEYPVAYLNITSDLTKQGRKKIKVDDILRFDDGTELKIMRKNREGVWAKRVKTYDPQMLKRHQGHDVDMKKEPLHCNTCSIDLK